METYTETDLTEALRAVGSLISKSEKVLEKMADHPSQHTLLTRRIKALRIGEQLIQQALAKIQAEAAER